MKIVPKNRRWVWLCRYPEIHGCNDKGRGNKTDPNMWSKQAGIGEFCDAAGQNRSAGTYICAAAAARSEITLSRVPVEEMKAFLEVYQKIGGQYYGKSGTLKINGREACLSCAICADRNLSRISHRSAGTAYGCSHRKSWRECHTGADF